MFLGNGSGGSYLRSEEGWLARNEGMDPYSSPPITPDGSFHFLCHSVIPQLTKGQFGVLF